MQEQASGQLLAEPILFGGLGLRRRLVLNLFLTFDQF